MGRTPTRTCRPPRLPDTGAAISKSAYRALDVLEFFGQARRPLRASEVARRFEMGPSTTDKLMKTMVLSGYLTFDPINKMYFPSLRLADFATWLNDGCFWPGASAELTGMRANLRADVSIAVRNDNVMQIQVFASANADANPSYEVAHPPLHSAAGRAFLATRERSEMDRIVERAVRFRKLPKDCVRELVDGVEAVRARGYACGPSLFFEDRWTLGVAIPKSQGAPDPGAVIAASGNRDDLQARETDVVEALKQYAKRLSAQPTSLGAAVPV